MCTIHVYARIFQNYLNHARNDYCGQEREALKSSFLFFCTSCVLKPNLKLVKLKSSFRSLIYRISVKHFLLWTVKICLALWELKVKRFLIFSLIWRQWMQLPLNLLVTGRWRSVIYCGCLVSCCLPVTEVGLLLYCDVFMLAQVVTFSLRTHAGQEPRLWLETAQLMTPQHRINIKYYLNPRSWDLTWLIKTCQWKTIIHQELYKLKGFLQLLASHLCIQMKDDYPQGFFQFKLQPLVTYVCIYYICSMVSTSVHDIVCRS